MSDFKPSEEVLAEAVEAGTRREWEKFGVSGEPWEDFQEDPRHEIWLNHVRAVLAAAAPILTAEAFRAGETAGREKMEARIEAAAPVLLGAGREQEQARIRDEVKARMDRAREDYDRDPQAYHRGREDELDLLLDFLSPVSEEPGGRDEVSSDASASGAATNLGSEPTTEKGENR